MRDRKSRVQDDGRSRALSSVLWEEAVPNRRLQMRSVADGRLLSGPLVLCAARGSAPPPRLPALTRPDSTSRVLLSRLLYDPT